VAVPGPLPVFKNGDIITAATMNRLRDAVEEVRQEKAAPSAGQVVAGVAVALASAVEVGKPLSRRSLLLGRFWR
jgi:hypothetical protein